MFTARFAGQLAGLVMVSAMVLAAALWPGVGALRPLQVIASLVLGRAALDTHALSALAVGVFVHLSGPTYFWSRMFGLVVGYARHPLSWGRCLALGVAFGIVAELVDVRLLLPAAQKAINGADLWRETVPVWWDWAAHLVFGIALGLWYGRLQPRGELSSARG